MVHLVCVYCVGSGEGDAADARCDDARNMAGGVEERDLKMDR